MAHTDPHGHAPGPAGHETSDANLSSAPAIIAITLVFLAVVFAAMWFLLTEFRSSLASQDTPPPAIAGRQGDRVPPGPRLQRSTVSPATPEMELQQLRAAEDEVLNGYGWVDRPAGVAQIPVARAIELIAEQGLPAPPSLPAPGAPAAVQHGAAAAAQPPRR